MAGLEVWVTQWALLDWWCLPKLEPLSLGWRSAGCPQSHMCWRRNQLQSELKIDLRRSERLRHFRTMSGVSVTRWSSLKWISQKEIALQQPTAPIFSALTAGTIKLTNFTFLWFTDNGWEAAGAATEIMPMEKSFEQVSISGLPLCLCCCPSPVAHTAALSDNEHSQGFVK